MSLGAGPEVVSDELDSPEFIEGSNHVEGPQLNYSGNNIGENRGIHINISRKIIELTTFVL
jgi:hypothetical protein